MNQDELRTQLLITDWHQTTEVPLYWERWVKGNHNLYIRLEPFPGADTVGRFAQDGNSIFDAHSFAELATFAKEADES